mmetsp:Transcript_46286/g.122861  ORF Transcript_46286/g.122861 Transcript_46286/m.122861 type:complete len:270 (-) Transcript_46286:2429-3238(-)
MKPIERPNTNNPFKQPKSMKSCTSESEKAPHDLSMSMKHTAMQPSTFNIKFARFLVVTCSTPNAKSRIAVLPKLVLAYSLMMTTRWSGLSSDFIRCPIPMMSLLALFMLSTKSFGFTPLDSASANILAASSRAPPKRGPMVNKPLHNEETRSLPARAETMVLWAPLTAGPWSAVTIKIISINFVHWTGNCLLNHKRDNTPPTPRSCLNTSEIATPQYLSSSPRSSAIEDMKLAGLRTNPSFLAQVKSSGTVGVGSSGSSTMSPSSTIFV